MESILNSMSKEKQKSRCFFAEDFLDEVVSLVSSKFLSN